jgi:hypothetical protein
LRRTIARRSAQVHAFVVVGPVTLLGVEQVGRQRVAGGEWRLFAIEG